MTGSSFIPIVVPIMAFLAMGFWLGMIFYAAGHPGYRHRKTRPRPDDAMAEADAGGADAGDSGAGDPAGPEHERIDEQPAGALLG